MELLVLASASASPDAPLSLQLEQVAGSLGQAAVACALGAALKPY